MDIKLFEKLYFAQIISANSYARVKLVTEKKLHSLHWEIKTLLYLGVLLLSGGLGVLVYKNIDTIGHQAILLFIALVCGGSFFYCTKNKLSFSNGKVNAPNSFFDYVLLLGCSSFIIFVAYLQYQYNVFGNRYGAATFFPMLVLFFSAYYFDHIGILCMAITNLGTWLGLTITPLHILNSNDFDNSRIIFTGLLLGTLLLSTGWITYHRNIKKHFEFSYTNFGVHVLLISCFAGMVHFSIIYLLWFLLLTGICYFFYRKALQEKSFYFLLIITLYAYTTLSYVFIDLISRIGGFGLGDVYLSFLYFIISAIGMVMFLIKTNKKFKTS